MVSAYIDKIKTGESLRSDEAEQCLNTILEKDVPDKRIAELLVALSEKGESADEILGFSRALLAKSRPVPLPSNAIDSCGTGGSGPLGANASGDHLCRSPGRRRYGPGQVLRPSDRELLRAPTD